MDYPMSLQQFSRAELEGKTDAELRTAGRAVAEHKYGKGRLFPVTSSTRATVINTILKKQEEVLLVHASAAYDTSDAGGAASAGVARNGVVPAAAAPMAASPHSASFYHSTGGEGGGGGGGGGGGAGAIPLSRPAFPHPTYSAAQRRAAVTTAAPDIRDTPPALLAKATVSPLLSDEQNAVLDAVMQGKNLFLTGAAGTGAYPNETHTPHVLHFLPSSGSLVSNSACARTGKTFVFNQLVVALKQAYGDDAVAVTASTGKPRRRVLHTTACCLHPRCVFLLIQPSIILAYEPWRKV